MTCKIAINGFLGKMGQSIYDESKKSSLCDVKVGCDTEEKINNNNFDKVMLTSDLEKNKDLFDVVIDFSLPVSSTKMTSLCAKLKKPLSIGTTGFSKTEIEQIKIASKSIPILLAPNMSYGVNLCFSVLTKLAKNLKDYTATISETHHKNKMDSPSGTAIKMAEVICKARNIELGDIKSDKCPIKIESNRVDSEIGTHEVIFKNALNEVKLVHTAFSRSIFSKGALDTALWVVKKPPGLYQFRDFMEDQS